MVFMDHIPPSCHNFNKLFKKNVEYEKFKTYLKQFKERHLDIDI